MWDLQEMWAAEEGRLRQQVFCSRARDETRGLNLEEGRD